MKIYALILCLFFSINVYSQPYPPVNKNASPEAQKLLSYLYSISGKQILSGEHNFNQNTDLFSDSVKAITGKYPALWGTDFIWNGTKDNGQKIVDESIKKNKEGYIITLMWHQGRPIDEPPFSWKESVQGKLTDAQWNELITPNTPLHTKWLAQVDVIASYLKKLQEAHVPVLWRPYHEMNGVWFWWGNRPGKNGISKLWKMMYERFVTYHHLNNLLWVWGANAPRDLPGDEAYAYKEFYPGADFVDILGTDVYHYDYEQNEYQQLLDLAKGKVIALSEVGQLPSAKILKAQPKWVWFMIWTSWLWTDNKKDAVVEMYNSPQTISHGTQPLY